MIALALAAIPKPPEELVVLALVASVLLVLSFIGAAAGLVLDDLLDDGQRRALGVGLVVGLLALCLVVLGWSCVSQAGTRTLSWTMPLTTARANAEGRIVDCAGGDSTLSLAGWRLFAQIQSPTWVREDSTMLRDEARYVALWPQVRNEALPRQVKSASSKHLPRNGAGMRMTTTVPDSLDGQPVLLWFVEIFNDSGKVSCPSNRIGARP